MVKSSIADLTVNNLSGVLANAINTIDKALIIEKDIGLDAIYTLVSMGKPMLTIADSIGLSMFELEFILKRTSANRKKLINAQTMALTQDSLKVLNQRSNVVDLDTGEALALKHHSSMLDKTLKIVNAQEQDTGGGNIVVNNTVVVRHKSDIPPIPEELQKIIEGEKC